MSRNKKIKNNFFSDGHLNEETIAFCAEALFLGKINLVDEVIKKHLGECIQCKEEVFVVSEEINSNKDFKSQINENDRRRKIHEKPGRNVANALIKIAASLLVLISIGTIYYFIFITDEKTYPDSTLVYENDSIKGRELNNKIDSAKISIERKDIKTKENNQQYINNEVLAMNMKESEFFENLISSDFRDNNSFEVTEPLNGSSYMAGQKVEFKFAGDLSVPIELSIYKNNEVRIFRTDSITALVYPCQMKLDKGLYYWKVRVSKELMDAGKFYIK